MQLPSLPLFSILASAFGAFFSIFWWVPPLLLLLAFAQSPIFKGFIGELAVRLLIRVFLDRKTYHALHDVTLPTHDGTTQIDHILVSPYGIFVLETKNLRGWIYGRPQDATWTQKIYRKSYRFQNPLRQNYKHVKTLEELLKLPPTHFHSCVVFVGDSTFKTPMPPEVTYASGCLRFIKSRTQPLLSESDMRTALDLITTHRRKPSAATARKHRQHLVSRHH